jgi:hypothetical protein
MSPKGGGTQQMSAAQQAAMINAQARAQIKASAVKMQQPLQAGSMNPATNPTLIINPRNVGLILGFLCEIQHTVVNGSAVTINLTDFANLNALAYVQFNDFNNTTRIQTPGWHVGLINSVRAKRPYGTALVRTTGFDSTINYGANWTNQIGLTVAGAPATSIAAGATGILTMWYWVPIAYSDEDLRGTIYANVVNAQSQLILTMPGAAGGTVNNGVSVCVANGTDSTQAMFVGAAAGAITAVTISSTAFYVSQYYWDQLPVVKNNVLLPVTDLATVYELKSTTQSAIVPNTDIGYQYANFRNFLSTIAVYVNTAATGARGVGADINSWSLQAANTTNLWKKTPAQLALENRNFFSTDYPPGVYYFGTRQRPIITTQYGNMQLILNALTANTGAYQMTAVEDFALIQALSMAGSLPTS